MKTVKPDQPDKLVETLQRLAAKSAVSERNIIISAKARRDVVISQIEAIRGGAHLGQGNEYMRLIEERGQLDRVISSSTRYGG